MNCPSCAAPFQWFDRFAELVVCSSCQATCLVDGASLQVKGKMALLAPPEGMLSLGAMGSLQGVSFTVVGRVRYAYKRGYWDEWYLQLSDGSHRWISEDEGKLQISRLKKGREPVGRFTDAKPGSFVALGAESYHVNEKGIAECIGGEGQLPFVVEQGEKTPFLDISRGKKVKGTIEFTESGDVRIYIGRLLAKTEIEIEVQGQRYVSDSVEGASKERFVQASVERAESYNCFGCGAALPVSAVDSAVDCEYCGASNNPAQASCTCPTCKISVALPAGNAAASLSCPQCHTCFEPSGEILSTQEENRRPAHKSLLKVGDRGTIEGTEYVVTGWVYSSGTELGWVFTSWDYMLYSPEKGYQWLVHSEDHFSLARSVPPVEQDAAAVLKAGSQGDKLSYDGRKYQVSGRGTSSVQWVEGQLPYVAKIGDESTYCDAANTPFLLTAEQASDEVEYFLARYMQREEVAEAFSLDIKNLYKPSEKAPHQPYPISRFRKQALLCMLVFAIFNFLAFSGTNPKGVEVDNFGFGVEDWQGESLSESFKLSKDNTIVRVVVNTRLNNDWVYVDLGLLDSDRRVIHEFGTTVQYYHGVDGGESWSEGGTQEVFYMKVPKAGDYRLILRGDSKRYRGPISLSVFEGCTLNGVNLFLLVLCVLWLGGELLGWMSFKGYIGESDDD